MARSYPLLESLYPPQAVAARVRPERSARVRPSVTPQETPHPAVAPAGLQVPAPGELVEFLVYGVDDEDQTQEVHLAFRDEVVRGVYLKLRFETAGVRAIFMVRDVSGRRWAAAYGEQILARLSSKGLRTQRVDIEEVVE
jgi:hypothetical protein